MSAGLLNSHRQTYFFFVTFHFRLKHIWFPTLDYWNKHISNVGPPWQSPKQKCTTIEEYIIRNYKEIGLYLLLAAQTVLIDYI